MSKTTPLMPTSRQRKSRLASAVTKVIKEFEISKDDQVDVITLALKQLGILDRIQFFKKSRKGRSVTPFHVREAIWIFWHENSKESTNTNQIAKLRVNNKSHIQSGLEFVSTITLIKQRNRDFFQNIYKTVNIPFKELYIKYIQENPDNLHVSWGTFFALKPFYVRHVTSKDIEMCCCKLHLHARWSINALLDICKKQDLELSFDSYETFFNNLTQNCAKDNLTYISWQCTPSKKTLCNDIQQNWKNLKDFLIRSSDEPVTVPLLLFDNVPYTTKKGEEKTD